MSSLTVSYSELDAFRQCPHKHDLAFKQRWTPSDISHALDKGLLWHKVMENHYGAIQSESTHRARMQKIANLLITHSKPDHADLIAWMYDGYVERYGMDEQWEIVAIEEQHRVELPRPSPRALRVYLRMRIDLIVRERTLGRKIQLLDHKSAQNLPSDKELDLDDQFSLYTYGKRTLGVPIFGTIYSAARTQRNKVKFQELEDRFDRKKLYRTDTEVYIAAQEAYVTARRAYDVRNGIPPRAPDTERCRWRCPFTEPCLAGRKGMDEVKFLQVKGYHRMTEAEHLAYRGYTPPDGRERKEGD